MILVLSQFIECLIELKLLDLVSDIEKYLLVLITYQQPELMAPIVSWVS